MNILTYNGQNIEQRIDGYVNATQMAQSNNIRIADWLENEGTNKYLKAIQESISAEFGTNEKIIQIKGFGSKKATWVHPLVAIGFAQWISPEFHVWCNIHIKTLIETGKTELVEQPIRKLPQRDTIEYVEAQEKIEKINNATLKELLRDQLIDELSILRGKSLPQTKPTEYTIVKVRARELGYSTQEIGNGSALGKFVAKQINPAFVERVGKYGVKHYEVTDRLDTTIKTYFGLKKAIA